MAELSTTIKEIVADRVRDAGLEGRGILAALSGGVDSVCMTRVLARLAELSGSVVEVAHVDHGLREGSMADATFCRELAGELGLKFHQTKLSPDNFTKGVSVQAAARRARREFFARVARERNLSAVALAHHRIDQVETVLMKLLRGAGPRGAGGMRGWSPPWFRPLLSVGRNKLETLAQSEGWSWREDPTNATDKYTRNRVRNRLLPFLEAEFPGAAGALLRFSELAAEDDTFLTKLAHAEFAGLASRNVDGISFTAEEYLKLPKPLRSRVVLAGIEELGGDPTLFGAKALGEVDDLLAEGRPNRRGPFPGDLVIAKSYDNLWLLKPGVADPPKVDLKLDGPGDYPVGVWECVLIWRGEEQSAEHGWIAVPAAATSIEVRSWQPGDRIETGSGTSKVKDLLMEARVEPWLRRKGLVTISDGRIFGLLIPGTGWSGPVTGVGSLSLVRKPAE